MRKKSGATYKRTFIRRSADFSTEALQARREWDDIFKTLKEKTVNQEFYTWQSCPSEMDKDLPKQKLRELINTRPALQEMLKGVLYVEVKGC